MNKTQYLGMWRQRTHNNRKYGTHFFGKALEDSHVCSINSIRSTARLFLPSPALAYAHSAGSCVLA
jgi:hypothetical protein